MILALVTQLVSCIVPKKGPRKALAKARTVAPFDAVIVPGVPFKNGSWDSVMKMRVIWSWILYKNGYVKNVIYSGAAVYSPYKEAVIMGLYGQQLGIPAAHIFYDTMAKHSTENVYYSYLLARQQGFKTLALGTDPFQSFLLKGFTKRRFESPIYILPVLTDSLAAYNNLSPDINPKPARVKNWTSITETQSFFKRFRGTLGRDIDFSQYKDGKVEAL
jgi:hypothetical protein